MRVVKKAVKMEIIKAMKKDAAKKFAACSHEKCPRCRVSDGWVLFQWYINILISKKYKSS